MKAESTNIDIVIGGFYHIRFGNRTSVVRIMQEDAIKGGWVAFTFNDKCIFIRSISRIVGRYIPKVNSTIIEGRKV